MAHKVDIPAPAALALISAIIAAPYLMKPAEFRRNPVLEAKAFVGMTQRYEVIYDGCSDPSQNNDLTSPGGLVKGFAGGLGHVFPATSQEDAIAFAKSARPECQIDVFYRLKRVKRGGKMRLDRERIYL